MAEWTQERHKAAKARCDVATGQPWVVLGTPGHNYVDSSTEEICSSCGRKGWHGSLGADFDKVEDAAFCAGARTDLPDALTEIERLQADGEALVEKVGDLRREVDRLSIKIIELAPQHE